MTFCKIEVFYNMRLFPGMKIKTSRRLFPLLVAEVNEGKDWVLINDVTGRQETNFFRSDCGYIDFDGDKDIGSITEFCPQGNENWNKVSSISKENIYAGAVFRHKTGKHKVILLSTYDLWVLGGMGGKFILYSDEPRNNKDMIAYLSNSFEYLGGEDAFATK